jgi:NAD+ synthase (glutamine-hydrolysing)
MKKIKVAAGALNQTPLDWKGNLQNIRQAIEASAREKVGLLCLPELCITGYGCEDAFLSNDVQQRALTMLYAISRMTDMALCVGLPVVYGNALYNCIAVINGGRILGFVAKQHLAGDGIHYEPRWFKPWPSGKQGKVSFNPTSIMSPGDRYLTSDIPIGDLIFDFQGVKVGFEICEDAWVAERPGSRLARQGVDIILNPSASHFAFGKQEIRKRFVIEGSRAFAATYVYANLLGNEAGRALYDGEGLIATGGRLVAQGSRFSMRSMELTTAVVDLQVTRTQQIGTASFEPEFREGVVQTVPVGLGSSEEKLSETVAYTLPDAKHLEFRAAVTLGLYDYLRKSRSKGFVISLSGGADSAACAYLVRLMVGQGLAELGPEIFCRNVGIPYSKEGSYNEEVFAHHVGRRLLTCVYQKTRNSSDTTLKAAEAVAGDCNANFIILDVEEVVRAYTGMVAVGLQHEFDWDKDDLALQNIQARSRAPSVWMIANVENKLLITTSNRSEAAVGYCTMDGDTAGSIAPLAGIDKAYLREWLRHMESLFPRGLELVNRQAPTAELRPNSTQTDERDLMPYPILEAIEDYAILERRSPREAFRLLEEGLCSGESPNRIYGYVEKFYRLWCRNQWKRERYALSFHLDDKNLDPRSWCRFPVLSGGYETELLELRQELGL